MNNQDLTHQIIGASYDVYNKLGFGFLESVYKKSLIIELKKRNLSVVEEKPLSVYYDQFEVGSFFVDLFVENEIIVELKSVNTIIQAHEVQLVNYLNGLNMDIGLLINFGPSGVEVKKKFRQAKEK